MTADNTASDGCMNNNDTTYEPPEVCAGEGSKHENDVSVIAMKQNDSTNARQTAAETANKRCFHPTFSGAGSIAMKKNTHYTPFK